MARFIAPRSDSRSGRGANWILFLVAVCLLAAIAIVQSVPEPINPPGMHLPPNSAALARSSRFNSLRPLTTSASQSPTIRVNVTPGGSRSLTLSIDGPYVMREVESRRELLRGKSLQSCNVESSGTGIRIGRDRISEKKLEIVPTSQPSIRVNDHLYRGVVRLYRRTDDRVSAVNVLPVEDYLASVVDSEMPASFPEAARQAQAVVARTYALYQKEHADRASVYDLFSSQRSQKYLGVEYLDSSGRRLAGESASSRKAVADTCGIVCQHGGQVFSTYYSACCGGQTTIGRELFEDAVPILKSVTCDWCRDSKYFRWSANVGRKEFLDSVKSLKPLSALASVQQTAGPGRGVISQFRISDGRQSAMVSGVQLRDLLPSDSVRSPHFTLELDRDSVRIQGRGHGHGVGFCQWGAAGQARSGKSWVEIVRYYYPGVELTTAKY